MNSLADHSDEELVRSCQAAMHPAHFNDWYGATVPELCAGATYTCTMPTKPRMSPRKCSSVCLRACPPTGTRCPLWRGYRPSCATAVWTICVRDKRALHQELSEHIAAPWEEELDTEAVAVPTEALVYQLLDKLRGEDKYLLLLYYREGYSTKQLGEALLVSEAVIRKRMQRARDKMQGLLEKHRGPSTHRSEVR